MVTFSRTDRSLVSQWWWTVDRWTIVAIAGVIAVGAVLTLAASPSVAERLGFDTYHFVRRQFVFLPLGLAIIVATAFLSPRGLRRLAVGTLGIGLFLTALVPLFGAETNGAARWLRIGGFSLQPSEFLKPGFAFVVAWLAARHAQNERFPGFLLASALLAVCAGLLLVQPDVGMTAVLAATWGVALFLAGLSFMWVGLSGALAIAGAIGAYWTFAHVRARVDGFLDPAAPDSYQVSRALQAFRDGGLFGRGPGEGRVKEVLPDAHADFVFAVAGEEFGLVLCLLVVAVFAFVVLRGFSRALLRRRSVRLDRGCRPADPVRAPGPDQPGVHHPPHSAQGHDPAVPVLWRIVGAVPRPDHRHGAGPDPRTAANENSAMSPHPATRVAIAAGGTGGHMFPAESLARELVSRGCGVDLITDSRGGSFGTDVDGIAVHRIAAGAVAGRSLVARLRSAPELAFGTLQARALLKRLAPQIVVGFGGYASVPTMLAASFAGILTALHEQNAVLGRANRLLAPRVLTIATSFARTAGIPSAARGKAVLTGMPVRPEFAAARKAPYAPIAPDGPVRLLVLGGSQGAHVFSHLVPRALGLLPAAWRRRLQMVQQCRPEDMDPATAAFAEASVAAELASFFDDVPRRLAVAHLVICRSGASTVTELCAVGRPALLVPFPHAIDDHQTANAQALDEAGAGWLMPELSLTPELLARRLESLFILPTMLAKAADCAAAAGLPDAVAGLADRVLALLPNGAHDGGRLVA